MRWKRGPTGIPGGADIVHGLPVWGVRLRERRMPRGSYRLPIVDGVAWWAEEKSEKESREH